MSVPPISISECTTFPASFDTDLRAYAAAGADGIGIWEFKLPLDDDAASLAAFKASGLRASICVPTVPSICPDSYFSEPVSPRDRTEALCAAIRRLAPFEPSSILITTGDPRGRDAVEMRQVTVAGLREAAAVAAGFGIDLGIEGYRVASGSLVSTIPGMIGLADEVDRPNVGIVVDTWHVWDDPGVLEDLERHAKRIIGFQVCDWREPTRSWADRVLPGDGVIDWAAMIRAIQAGGYAGWYDVEIFSDDGRFGDSWPDSIWARDPMLVASDAVASMRRLLPDVDG